MTTTAPPMTPDVPNVPTVPTSTLERDEGGRVTVHRPAVAVIIEHPTTGLPVAGPVIWEGCETFRTALQAKREAMACWVAGEHLDDLADLVEVEA